VSPAARIDDSTDLGYPIRMHSRWSPFGRILLVLGGVIVASASILAAPLEKVVLQAQCDNPMELAVLPDGRVLFVERFGKVRLWKPDTGQTVLAAEIPVHGTVNAINAGQPDRGS
jgi:hypothetical protein